MAHPLRVRILEILSEGDSSPVEIDELKRAVDRLKIEELALKKEKDAASKVRLEKLRADMAERQEALDKLERRWQAEKASLHSVGDLRNKLNDARIDLERKVVQNPVLFVVAVERAEKRLPQPVLASAVQLERLADVLAADDGVR